ncbi:MAG: hypothetical protein ACLS9T_06560 [Streptococcus salivarius]
MCLPKEKELTLNLQSRDYHAGVKVLNIVRVFAIDNGWRYGVQFSEVPEADKREFYQYIYDALITIFQKKRPLDDNMGWLFENFSQRFQNNERPVSIQ